MTYGLLIDVAIFLQKDLCGLLCKDLLQVRSQNTSRVSSSKEGTHLPGLGEQAPVAGDAEQNKGKIEAKAFSFGRQESEGRD